MTSKSEKKRPSRRAEPAKATKGAPKQARSGKATQRTTPSNAAPSRAAPSDAAPISKLDTIIALLQRDDGATIAELVEVTGWQAHSVRGALAGSLKKKGYAVASSKHDGIRRYSLAP